MICGLEKCSLKETKKRKLRRTEMRMLRWIMGVLLRGHPRNEEVRRKAGVECIAEVIR